MVNELCFDRTTGTILANIYMSDLVIRIDPRSGNVIDQNVLTSLVLPSERTGREDVLNGIAALSPGNLFLLTGKLYAHFYVVDVEPKYGSVSEKTCGRSDGGQGTKC